MNIDANKRQKGFTLIEMLLVIVIISMVLYASMSYIQQRTLQQRIDRTSGQMQQILNASLSYYVMNGTWPANLACLQGTGSNCTITYIPPNTQSPWGGNPYLAAPAAPAAGNGTVFYVWAHINSHSANGSAYGIAQEIAGTLPLSYVSSDAGSATAPPNIGQACTAGATDCYVVASVNIPGQNLNNATAVNFSGLYHNGGCVPVPQCPVDSFTNNQMVPQVFVVPVSVSGLNDPSPSPNSNVYPISSFTAYATGPSATPPNCQQTSPTSPGASCGSGNGPNPTFWRACLQIYTEKGLVNAPAAEPTWGNLVTVMAITRCAVSNEPAGSPFTVYQ